MLKQPLLSLPLRWAVQLHHLPRTMLQAGSHGEG